MHKYLVCCIVSLLLSLNVSAQKITYHDQTIYVDDEPYALMKKSGTFLPNYSIQTLDGEEFAMARYDKVSGRGQRYIITFVSDGQKGTMRYDISFGKKLAKELVESHVIKKGKFNPDGEKRFLLANPMPDPNEVTTSDNNKKDNDTYIKDYAGDATNKYMNNTNDNNGPVERDRTQTIIIAGNAITQGGVTIGNYKKKTSASGGNLFDVYSFYLPDGTKVAEATIKQFEKTGCKIVTIKDNKAKIITLSSAIDFEQAKEIATYLSEHYYL